MTKPTIIVADDEDMVREVLARQLIEKGYDVRSAPDGASAWEMFQQHPVEVLLTDLDMPRMNGKQLIEQVKQHSPATIVIVLTGNGSIDSARQIIEIGCDEYLLKPVEDINELDLVLKRSIERHRVLLQAIVSKRLNKAKSFMIHGLTGDLVEPTHALLNSIDPLIGLINKGDNRETLAFVEGIKKNIIDLCAVVGKLAENSDRLKTVEQE